MTTATGTSDEGSSVRGDTDFDVTILKLDLVAPPETNCLRFDFRFLSEEFPEFVGSDFNDGFIAELDTSTWTTAGTAISAPDNFAFDPSGDVISVNSTGATRCRPADADGTTYDGGTQTLRAGTPVAPGRAQPVPLDLRPGRSASTTARRLSTRSASSRSRTWTPTAVKARAPVEYAPGRAE